MKWLITAIIPEPYKTQHYNKRSCCITPDNYNVRYPQVIYCTLTPHGHVVLHHTIIT